MGHPRPRHRDGRRTAPRTHLGRTHLARRLAGAGLGLALLGLPLAAPAAALAGPSAAVLRPAAAPDAGTAPVDETSGDATYYVVQDAWEGQPEFLYSIAERLLGTGDRALEIFALNEGRAQPGGMTVSDPNVIRPGWVLLLPPDAAGEGVQVGPVPTVAPRAVRATPGASAGTSGGTAQDGIGDGADDGAADDEAGGGTAGSTGGSDERADAADDAGTSPSSWLARGATVLVVGTVVIAMVVIVVGGVIAARRRHVAASAAPPARPVRREDPGAWTIDRTTRALARACAEAGRPVPGVHTLVLSDDLVRLRLVTPDAQVPAGWTASDDRRTWTSPMRPLQDVALDERVVAPFPRLVTLGDDAQGRVLVDLAHAGPGVALDGDTVQATRLAERWVHELTTSPWARDVPVVAVGTATSTCERLEDAGPDVDAAGGGVLVVVNARARDGALLASLAEDPAWSVVVVGAAGGAWARWRLTIDADGIATGGPLDGDVHVAGGRRLERV